MARAQPIEISGMHFAKKGDASDYLKAMLNKYDLKDKVSEVDSVFLHAALLKHPDAKAKIGCGVKYFYVDRADYGTRCFWLHRTDGTHERFSYKSCLGN